jgi:ABC-type transporter Mla subunit MlaD
MVHTLTGKAIDISQKTEQVLNNLLELTDGPNRKRVATLLDSTASLASSLDTLVRNDRATKIMKNAERATSALARAAGSIDRVVAQIAPGVEATLGATSSAAKTLERMADRLRLHRLTNELTQAARALRERVEDPAITQVLGGFSSAAENVRRVTRDLGATVRRNDRQLNQLWSLLTRAADDLSSFSAAIKERPSLLLRGQTVKERDL